MIKGIGTDILERAKINTVFWQDNYLEDPFIRKTYTAKEIEIAESRSDTKAFYATRFAAKEAVFKALNTTGQDVKLIDIEILAHENGAPYVQLYASAAAVAKKRDISEILVSISYEDDFAIAYAIAQ